MPASSEDALNRRERVGQVVDAVDSLYVPVLGPADGAGVAEAASTNLDNSREEVTYLYHGADEIVPLALRLPRGCERCPQCVFQILQEAIASAELGFLAQLPWMACSPK